MRKNREVEVKLRVEDLSALRRHLAQIGAVSSGRVFESNTLYDTPTAKLRRAGQLLRIRTEIPGARSNHKLPRIDSQPTWAILTYKGPINRSVPATRASRLHKKRYKDREEFELRAQNPEMLARIVTALGYRPSFCYEKYRTAYRLPSCPGLALDLDETPVGIFLELEGPRRMIDRAAKLLGYSWEDYRDSSYWEVYRDHCRRAGTPIRNMVFPD
jgi:adenylate cyclase, class 2